MSMPGVVCSFIDPALFNPPHLSSSDEEECACEVALVDTTETTAIVPARRVRSPLLKRKAGPITTSTPQRKAKLVPFHDQVASLPSLEALARTTLSPSSLWPGVAPVAEHHLVTIFEQLDVEQLQTSESGSIEIPDWGSIVPLDPAVAVAAELSGLIFPSFVSVLKEPAIVAVVNGDILWSCTPEIQLEAAIAVALLKDCIVDSSKMRVVGPVMGEPGHPKRHPKNHWGRRVLLTLAYRAAQFKAMVDTEKIIDTESLVLAFRGFIAHPEWLANLRREKILADNLCGGLASNDDLVIDLLRRQSMKDRILGLEFSAQKKVNIESEMYHRFPRSADFIGQLTEHGTGKRWRGRASGCVDANVAAKAMVAVLARWCGTAHFFYKPGKKRLLAVANAWFSADLWDSLFSSP